MENDVGLTERVVHRMFFPAECFVSGLLCTAKSNKMPRYRRDNRAIRPIYECPEICM